MNLKKVIRGSSQRVFYEAPCRLWYTADQSEIVEDGDPRAATLYAAKGDLVPEEIAIKCGLVKSKASSPTKEGPYPYHTGGGWYLLSSGDRIKGKAAAQRAEGSLT